MKKIIKQIHDFFTLYHVFITMGVVLLVVLIVGFGEYRNYSLKKAVDLLSQKTASTTSAFTGAIQGLQNQITGIVAQNNLLNSTVQNQISKTGDLLDQVSQVNDTAIALDKLSKVDTQLLQKYSKVFFLNENYTPASLVTIPDQYVYRDGKNYQFYEKVEPFLERMLKAATDGGIDIKVISAYRSFGDQSTLKSTYNIIYGAGTANQFSADQGYSEHQLGTTIDFTTTELEDKYDTFDKTEAYTWLINNAYKYGFIMSYPKNNTYYVYEPWHWRFVGVDLAESLHRSGGFFYDLDQRKINNYLGIFFD